jgi:putative glycosyltransferase (TIGR04372 family)
MIVVIFDRVYIDTNIPKFFPGTNGEHVVEFYMGCSRGARLNKKVVVIKPKNPTNEKLYDLIPIGVDLQVVELKTIKGLMLRVLISVVSMEFIRTINRHLYSWTRTRLRRINTIISNKKTYMFIQNLMTVLQGWVESKFYKKKLFFDKNEAINGVNFEISNSDIVFSKEYLEKKNLNINNKFVCIHVRDDTVKGHDYRGCGINNYLSAIKYLEDNGYSVVKIGLRSNIKCNELNVIDLSHDKVPEIIPIYLISKCEFVVSYDTGFVQYLSYMFNTPLLILNATNPFFLNPAKYNSMMVLKTLIKKDNKKEAEFIKFTDGSITILKKEGRLHSVYEFINNTEEEVLLSVKEMKQFIEDNFKINSDQVFLRKFLTDKNMEILEIKDHIGLHNSHMKWSGGKNIGEGVFCPWYAKKKTMEVKNFGFG